MKPRSLSLDELSARLADQIRTRLHKRRPYLADWQKFRYLRQKAEQEEERCPGITDRPVYRCFECGSQFFRPQTCCGGKTKRAPLKFLRPIRSGDRAHHGWSVVMLTRNHAHLTRLAIESLQRSAGKARLPVEFLIVDCSSTDGSHDYLWKLSRKENVALIVCPPHEPFVYARNCNRGANAAAGKYLLFANNDIEVHGKGLFVQMERAFRDLPVAVLGVQTNQPGPNRLQDPRVRIAPPAHMSHLPVYGLLWAVRADAFWQLGGMDENFTGYGCDELEFQYRAALDGRGIGVVPTFVHHDHHATFGDDYSELARKNEDYFLRKYGVHMFLPRSFQPFLDLASERNGAPATSRKELRSDTKARSRSSWHAVSKAKGNRDFSRSSRADQPSISIVIPCYGRQELFNDTLWSCLEQDYERYEIIVVDDCSPERIVIPYPSAKVRMFRLARNRGESYARNYGIRRARGDYIKLMDSDDLFVDTTSLRRFAEFAGRTHADYLYCPAQLFEVGTGRVGKFREHEIDHRINKRNFIATSQMLIRRTVFRKVPFPEDVRYAEDYAFTLAVYHARSSKCANSPSR